MNTHKVTVTQRDPQGNTYSLQLDVLAATEDLALARAFGWYNRRNEYLENGNEAARDLYSDVHLHPNTPLGDK